MSDSTRPTILIVEDEQSSATLMSLLLANHYETEVAHDGERAIELMKVLRPDLILLDVVMPRMDGYQVLEAIQELYADDPVPVIFITGLNTPDAEVRALSDGAVDFIHKPFQPDIVQARIRLHLELQYKTKALTKANKELERLSRIDPLTELANRRHLEETAAHEVDRARRQQRPLSLITLDIDHFKKVNDQYGHIIGDLVLKAFANYASQFMRASDFLARTGGEEFVFLLPDTSLDNATDVAKRFRLALESFNIDIGNNEKLQIRVSAGVAQFTDSDINIEGTFARADKALYDAKQQGRNKVVAQQASQASG
jgi:two-component system cell cycle response regulator